VLWPLQQIEAECGSENLHFATHRGSGMAFTIERIKTYRRWFGWGFVGSFLVFAIVLAFVLMPDAPSGYRLPDDNRMSPPLDAEKVLALGFLVISFTTLIGFVVTTGLRRPTSMPRD
jgi:hypothetical protein